MSERALELSDLLKELQSEGSLDSQGKFSLDVSKAKDKLAEFQLENKYDYSLKLVQAAVASGASHVLVEVNNQRARFRFDGKYLKPQELADLFYYLVESQERPQTRHLRYLASAVNSAVAVGARQIWLDCWSGKEGFRHLFTAEGRSQVPLGRQSEKTPFTEFGLTRSVIDVAKGWWHTGNCDVWDLLTRSRNTMEKEQASIWDKCSFSPIPIKLNGKLLNRFSFGEPRWPGYVIANDPRPGESVPPWWVRFGNNDYASTTVHKFHHLIERYVPAGDGCLSPIPAPPHSHASIQDNYTQGMECEAILAIQAALSSESSLAIVEDGVILSEDHSQLGTPGLVGLVSAHGLTKDISGFNLTKDAAYHRRMQDLRREVAAMMQALYRERDRLPPEVRKHITLHTTVSLT